MVFSRYARLRPLAEAFACSAALVRNGFGVGIVLGAAVRAEAAAGHAELGPPRGSRYCPAGNSSIEMTIQTRWQGVRMRLSIQHLDRVFGNWWRFALNR